jgi:hypothetical protein
MFRISVRSALLASAVALAGLAPAIGHAQTTPHASVKSVRGTVEKLDGNTLTVKTSTGQTETVDLTPGWGVRSVVPSSLSDIKAGTFIGTATTGPDSQMVAREVVVFPDSMKGTGEGSYPWDLTPGSTMTNATVDGEVKATSGQELSLTYKGGTKKVMVPPGVPVVTFKPGDKSMVVPGAHIFARGPAKADGTTITAGGVAVGANGLTPPM